MIDRLIAAAREWFARLPAKVAAENAARAEAAEKANADALSRACPHTEFSVISRRRMPSVGDPNNHPQTNVWYSGYDEVVERCHWCGREATRRSLERPAETLAAFQAGLQSRHAPAATASPRPAPDPSPTIH